MGCEPAGGRPVGAWPWVQEGLGDLGLAFELEEGGGWGHGVWVGRCACERCAPRGLVG